MPRPRHNVFSDIFKDFLFGFELFWLFFFLLIGLLLVCFGFHFLGSVSEPLSPSLAL